MKSNQDFPDLLGTAGASEQVRPKTQAGKAGQTKKVAAQENEWEANPFEEKKVPAYQGYTV